MAQLAITLVALGICSSCVAEDRHWRTIKCPPHEGALEHSFTPVTSGDPCDTLEGWRVLSGPQNARASLSRGEGRGQAEDKALQISYEFVGKDGLEYVAIAPELPVQERGCYVGLWARVEGDGGTLRFRIRDSSGEIHQGDLGSISENKWCFYAGQIRSSPRAWGGDGNKVLDFPCVVHSILLDRPRKGYRGSGQLMVEGLALLRPHKPREDLIKVSVPSGHFGNIFPSGEKVTFRIDRAQAAGEDKVEVVYRLTDFWGMETGRERLTVDSSGYELSLKPPGKGYFVCLMEIRLDGTPVQLLEARFAVLDPLPPLHKVSSSPFAMQTHYRSERWSLDSMPLLARAGMKYLRDEMSWGSVEREKGIFAFSERYDDYIARALALGIEPMIILDYGNPHYEGGHFPTTEEALAGFARYAAEIAKRYRGKVRYFEVWNEWTGGCGMRGKTGNTPENYVRLLRAASAAIRKANPEAFIIGVGGEHSGHKLDMIERMFKAGALQHMDAVSVHSYRYPRTPEESGLVEEILSVKRLIEEYGGKQHIWITEIGWPTHIGSQGSSEGHQARMLVRTYVQMIATGVVDHIFWYDFKDDGLNRFYNEHNFGIVRHETFNCAPKPAYVAYAVMSRLLTAAKFVGQEEVGTGALAYRFQQPDGSALLVAWAPDGECAITLPWHDAQITDLMGNEREATAVPGGVRITLSRDPVYFTVATDTVQ